MINFEISDNRLNDFKKLTALLEKEEINSENYLEIKKIIRNIDDEKMASSIAKVNDEFEQVYNQATKDDYFYDELIGLIDKLDLPFNDNRESEYRIFEDMLSFYVYQTFFKDNDKGLALLPFDYPKYYAGYAKVLNKQGKYDLALEYEDKALHYNPFHIEALLEKIGTYWGLKQYDNLDKLLSCWGQRCYDYKALAFIMLQKAHLLEAQGKELEAKGFFLISYSYVPNPSIPHIPNDEVQNVLKAINDQKEKYMPKLDILKYVSSYADAADDDNERNTLYDSLYRITKLEDFKKKIKS